MSEEPNALASKTLCDARGEVSYRDVVA